MSSLNFHPASRYDRDKETELEVVRGLFSKMETLGRTYMYSGYSNECVPSYLSYGACKKNRY